ncbi:MAG TPA: hypothetical protein VG367_10915 [Mucilaginibacter sp.]|jgi:hypothetical protein|nr:hypothetical protein [Mucilaginibacter sp.]
MENSSEQAKSPNYGLIALFIGIIYLFVQLGFFKTYIIHFPQFDGFKLLHHIHGMLMSGWMLLLIIQPLLIRAGKYKIHRFLGKLSYILAPLVLASMFLIVRLAYHEGLLTTPEKNIIPFTALNIPQLFTFSLFYLLAIIHIHKGNTAKHIRYMIGTAIIMVPAGLARILIHYFQVGFDPAIFVSLYLQVGLAVAFLSYDLIKKNDYVPNLIIAASFIISTVIYIERHSDAYMAFGTFFAHTFFK